MSIQGSTIINYKQDFNVEKQYKSMYGEVRTDFKLIEKMFNLLPKNLLGNPRLTWCDPCCGNGYFSIYLYHQLFKNLTEIKELKKRHHRIMQMLTMIELNPFHIPVLKNIFGEKSNIYQKSFLETNKKYDVIVGNPPFNSQGLKKVPTQTKKSKKNDGKTAWIPFLKHSINCLNDNGFLLFITPSIWMKEDHSCFQYITRYKIHKLHTMTNTETNHIFHKQAQTPTCYFLLQKTIPTIASILIYEEYLSSYTNYIISAKSIPLVAISIFNKLIPFVKKYGHIKVNKTSIRPSYKSFMLNDQKTKEFPYPNISTCRLNKGSPYLVVKYSDKALIYHKQPKLVLAHKMYGFPYLDTNGEYGICNRDNYVIFDNLQNLLQLQQFLSTTFIMNLFEGTRYRMKYLERYIFQHIPNINNISDFPQTINNQTISDYFGLNGEERKMINNRYKKKYTFFKV